MVYTSSERRCELDPVKSATAVTVLAKDAHVLLSLWTSHSVSNSSTMSPSFTDQLMISTSVIPSPISASLNDSSARLVVDV
jgi:hypothetical protein